MSHTRVIIVGSFKFPDRNASALRVTALAQLFVALGYKPILVGVSKAKAPRSTTRQLPKYFPQIEFWESPYPSTFLQWIRHAVRPPNIFHILPDLGTQATDILIFYNYPALAQLFTYLTLRHKNVQILADCTEWYDRPAFTSVKDIYKALDTWLRMHAVNFLTDGLIVVSPYLQNWYQRKKTLSVCLLPTSVPQSSEAEASGRDRSATKDMLLLTSGLGPVGQAWSERMWKDRIDWGLRLYKSLSAKHTNLRLIIVGVPRARLFDIFVGSPLLEMLKTPGVVVQAPIGNTEARDYVRRSYCTVVLRSFSRRMKAGFPTKIFESLSLGTPVVTNLHRLHPILEDLPSVIKVDFDEVGTPKQLSALERFLDLNAEAYDRLRQAALASKKEADLRGQATLRRFLAKLGHAEHGVAG